MDKKYGPNSANSGSLADPITNDPHRSIRRPPPPLASLFFPTPTNHHRSPSITGAGDVDVDVEPSFTRSASARRSHLHAFFFCKWAFFPSRNWLRIDGNWWSDAPWFVGKEFAVKVLSLLMLSSFNVLSSFWFFFLNVLFGRWLC